MLLVFMYHRIWRPELPQAVSLFKQHLQKLVQRYEIVIPGESLAKHRLSLCLTFDDAYFDFYHHVYPLLKEFNIRAVLAIPVKFIIEQTSLPAEQRLTVPHSQMMQEGIYQTQAPFCTWQEIAEMVSSGHVIAASHSYNHLNLKQAEYDFQQEIIASKQIIEEKTGSSISTFVYPFGKMNKQLHKQVVQYYSYAMRIGSALNADWNNQGAKLIYRIDADTFWQQRIAWNKIHYYKYLLKYFSNLIRAR